MEERGLSSRTQEDPVNNFVYLPFSFKGVLSNDHQILSKVTKSHKSTHKLVSVQIKHIRAKTENQAIEFSLGKGVKDNLPEASYLPEYVKEIKNFEKQAAYAAITK